MPSPIKAWERDVDALKVKPEYAKNPEQSSRTREATKFLESTLEFDKTGRQTNEQAKSNINTNVHIFIPIFADLDAWN